MIAGESLIGRDLEETALLDAIADARAGRGRVLLLAGEAGIGKTRLAEAVLCSSTMQVLRGSARQEGTPPYGPLVEALRGYLRTVPDGLAGTGPLGAQLALLLPELGAP